MCVFDAKKTKNKAGRNRKPRSVTDVTISNEVAQGPVFGPPGSRGSVDPESRRFLFPRLCAFDAKTAKEKAKTRSGGPPLLLPFPNWPKIPTLGHRNFRALSFSGVFSLCARRQKRQEYRDAKRRGPPLLLQFLTKWSTARTSGIPTKLGNSVVPAFGRLVFACVCLMPKNANKMTNRKRTASTTFAISDKVAEGPYSGNYNRTWEFRSSGLR